jgi:hypothetical protein
MEDLKSAKGSKFRQIQKYHCISFILPRLSTFKPDSYLSKKMLAMLTQTHSVSGAWSCTCWAMFHIVHYMFKSCNNPWAQIVSEQQKSLGLHHNTSLIGQLGKQGKKDLASAASTFVLCTFEMGPPLADLSSCLPLPLPLQKGAFIN